MADQDYIAAALARRTATAPIIQNPVIQPASGGVIKSATGATLTDSTGLVSAATVSVLVNGGTQVVGPLTGVAGPPTGLSGVGGEVILSTGSFNLARQATVEILALCSNYVNDAGIHQNAHSIYLQIDGLSEAGTAYGVVPVFTTGDTEARAHSSTILKIVTLGTGAHTVNVIWNSQEDVADTIINGNNAIYVFLLGS